MKRKNRQEVLNRAARETAQPLTLIKIIEPPRARRIGMSLQPWIPCGDIRVILRRFFKH